MSDISSSSSSEEDRPLFSPKKLTAFQSKSKLQHEKALISSLDNESNNLKSNEFIKDEKMYSKNIIDSDSDDNLMTLMARRSVKVKRNGVNLKFKSEAENGLKADIVNSHNCLDNVYKNTKKQQNNIEKDVFNKPNNYDSSSDSSASSTSDDEYLLPNKKARKNTLRPEKLDKNNSKSLQINQAKRRKCNNKTLSPSVLTSSKDDFPIYSPKNYDVETNLLPLESNKNHDNNQQNGKQLESSKKWETLKHNGVMFPPIYEPHGVKLKYNGDTVDLTPEQEEAATQFAVLLESEHAKNPVFCRNFFSDQKKLLGKDHIIKNFEDVDFRPIFDQYQVEKQRKAELRKNPEVKLKLKEDKAMELNIYGYALVDGVKQRIGNYMVELPGLFRGRGKHPKTGKIKPRIMPEDVYLNIGRNEKIPQCPIKGHNQGGIMHNNLVQYIARQKDPIQDSIKCVYLHASSKFKCENDIKKYEVARSLKKCIENVRKRYMSELEHEKEMPRQRATAVQIIDRLAIRVGNEKDTSETADTVGVCTLRLEHIEFLENESIKLDFLGKDSMRYLNTVKVLPIIYRNLQQFCCKKKKDDVIFNMLSTSTLNEYLSELMEGLTAKVFRTFNASSTLQDELKREDQNHFVSKDDTIDKKKFFYDDCNRQVAILCNHQKTVSKTFDSQVEKSFERLKSLKAKLEECKYELKEAMAKNKANNEASKTKINKKRLRNPEQIKKSISSIKARIEKCELNLKLKKSTKEIALGTSKINYMDPRISVAFCKRKELPIEKIFQKSLLDKFPWAMDVSPDFNW